MQFQFSSAAPKITSETLVVGVFEDSGLSTEGKNLNTSMKETLSQAISKRGFKGKLGKTLSLLHPREADADQIILIGLGKRDECSPHLLTEAGGFLYSALTQEKIETATFLVGSESFKTISSGEIAAHVAQGLLLKSFYFGKHQTKKETPPIKALASVNFYVSSEEEAKTARMLFDRLVSISEGVFYTRAVTSEPPNMHLTQRPLLRDLKASLHWVSRLKFLIKPKWKNWAWDLF